MAIDRLRGEVLQQSDLLVCERADFLAVERNRPERYVILAQWFDHNAAGTREVNDGASQLIPGEVRRILSHIGERETIFPLYHFELDQIRG
jgi:hypothetical protein